MLNSICSFLEIEPFTEEDLNIFSEKKYNTGIKYQINQANQETLEKLQNYFERYNQRLYELLGYTFDW